MTPRPGPVRAPAGYGLAAAPADGSVLPWSRVEEWLVAARSYWVVTTRADGRPHAMPVWGLWLDGGLWFSTDPVSLKGCNLAARPEVVVHLESGDEVAVLEGTVERVGADDLPRELVGAYHAKYDFELDPSQPSYGFYVLRPRVALTWLEADFPMTATRWELDP